MYKRDISDKIQKISQKFPVLELTGPRQSGKTTLAQELFRDAKYISLEDLETRAFAKADPKGFLSQYGTDSVVIDEAQHVPELFSYIQLIVDKNQKPGQFILTGSQNFLLHEKITQSLAGRVAILQLLPLSLSEMQQANINLPTIEEILFSGGYPRIYQANIEPTDWFSNYIQTYVERDIRQIKNITNLSIFQRFLKMCAYRAGQLINLSELGNSCGISHNTALAWLSILETSYITFSLKPYHQNFNKRLVKMPKLYFYDTGLLCHLLDIRESSQLVASAHRGHIYENFVITELMKKSFNQGQLPRLYFWRDKTGHEIDCIVDNPIQAIPIEIKAGKTITADYFKNLNYWLKLNDKPNTPAYLVYAGEKKQQRYNINVIGWNEIPNIKVES